MCVYLLITAGARCLILNQSRGYAHLEVEYLMISCRPYLQREFSAIFFVAVYLPPQTDSGLRPHSTNSMSIQVASHPVMIGSPIGWRTIGPMSSRFGWGRHAGTCRRF